MSIRMTGIDHNLAGIDVRTVFSFTKKKKAEALEYLKTVPGIDGCVILSTCNRMELWASTSEEFHGSFSLLCEIKQVSPEPYEDISFTGRVMRRYIICSAWQVDWSPGFLVKTRS